MKKLRALIRETRNKTIEYEGKLIGCANPDSPRVYMVKNGKKHWITSSSLFAEMGCKGADINWLDDDILNLIPDGEPFQIDEKKAFVERDTVRYLVAEPYLKPNMRGFEIGAGALPSRLPPDIECLHIDKRSQKELEGYFSKIYSDVVNVKAFDQFHNYFPDGADFFIAHNVLEHTANPIKQLIEWNHYLKRDGLAIVSIPHYLKCPGDKNRVLTTAEHLLLDFLLDRDENDVESREHIYSGSIGWVDSYNQNLSISEYAQSILSRAKRDKPEHHFHALDDTLFWFILMAASYFSDLGIKILAKATPFDEDKQNLTFGDVVAVYQVLPYKNNDSYSKEFTDQISLIANKLERALTRLQLA